MGWLQKKNDIISTVSYYNLNLNSKILLVGLGNPGDKYKLNFHNIGYMVADSYFEKIKDDENWQLKNNLKSYIYEGFIDNTKIIIAKPQTFMNESGQAISQLIKFYKIEPEKIVVIHDDFDLDFGVIRTRFGGSSAGHNGLKSIIDQIGENFNRVRIGINDQKYVNKSANDIVLKNFTKKQQSQFDKLYIETNSIIDEFVFSRPKQIHAETRRFITNLN